MSARKRKADDDGDSMSVSPTSSPAVATRPLARPAKKARSVAVPDMVGRPLSLQRLLQTYGREQLQMVLEEICSANPTLAQEVVTRGPRPTVDGVVGLLEDYQARLKAAVPYGESSAEYTYYRIRPALAALTDALTDCTPQFLPPHETQTPTSLQYLDAATNIIHDLPDWEQSTYRHHKDGAYDEISRAWALVIVESSKRAGGFNLHSGGWDQVLRAHHQRSGGKLGAAMTALGESLGWMGGIGVSGQQQQQQQQGHTQGQQQGGPPSALGSDPSSRFNQLMAGTLGAPLRVGY